jgi:hypothetical protein
MGLGYMQMEDDMMVYQLIEDMVLDGAKCSERSGFWDHVIDQVINGSKKWPGRYVWLKIWVLCQHWHIKYNNNSRRNLSTKVKDQVEFLFLFLWHCYGYLASAFWQLLSWSI